VVNYQVSDVQLYLFRHGQTEWSVSGQHTGRTNIPLTEEGRREARQLSNFVSHLQFSAVLVSPLNRAQESASLAGLASRITTCNELAEFDYGDYEGLTTEQIRERVPGWTIWTHPCPGGETMAEASGRCRKVIDMACGIGGSVALFAHGHILRILATVWLDLSPSEGKHLMLDTSTVSILSHEHDSPAIKTWNARVAD